MSASMAAAHTPPYRTQQQPIAGQGQRTPVAGCSKLPRRCDSSARRLARLSVAQRSIDSIDDAAMRPLPQEHDRAEPSAALERALDVPAMPAEVREAVQEGRLPPELLGRLADLYSNPALVPFLRFRSLRERLLADPSFFVKVGIEVGVGVFTKTSAELTKRGVHFGDEIDFVAANILMALIADYMLVFLPAPTISLDAAVVYGAVRPSRVRAPWARLFAGCPENAFQKVQPGGRRFSVPQRCGAVARNGIKLLAVGFGASLLGVSLTDALILLRHALDPSWSAPNQPQDVLRMSLAYASYMAVSSNVRYQLIAGVVEERGIESAFAGSPRLCNAASFVVRTSNTFIGSLLWVDYLRLLGLQPGH